MKEVYKVLKENIIMFIWTKLYTSDILDNLNIYILNEELNSKKI